MISLYRLAYQSVGVIYGDIGTSPLYVYSSTFSSNPSYDDLLGALSLIIWTLTLMVSIKYVLIVLRADDEGEGGTFAIYSLLSRYVWTPHHPCLSDFAKTCRLQANIVRRDPREEQTIKMERVKTQDLKRENKVARSIIERSAFMKTLLKVVGVLGVSLVMSGILPGNSIRQSKRRANHDARWRPHARSVCSRCHSRVTSDTSMVSSMSLTPSLVLISWMRPSPLPRSSEYLVPSWFCFS